MNGRRTARAVLRWAEVAALCCFCVFMLAGTLLFVQSRKDERALTRASMRNGKKIAEATLQAETKLTATLTDVRRVVLIAGGTMNEIRHTSITTRQAATEQRRLLRQATAEAIKTLRDTDRSAVALKNLLGGTDAQVNGKLLPQATTALENLSDAGQKLSRNLDQLLPVETSLAKAAQGFARTANDPNIPRALANVEGSTADLKETADYYRKKLTRPAAFGWHFFKVLLMLGGGAADAAQIRQAVQ